MKIAATVMLLVAGYSCGAAAPQTSLAAQSGPLTLQLDMPAEVPADRPLPLKLTLANTSTDAVQVTLGGRPPYDFVVTTENGTEAARWSRNQVIQAILELRTMSAGERVEYNVEWVAADGRGVLPPGSYVMRGMLNLDPPDKMETAPKRFRVRSAGKP